MKKFIYSLLTVAILASCETEVKTELSTLQSEKDSLSRVQKKVMLRIKAIEKELIKLDSTKKINTVTTINVVPQPFKHFFKVYGVVESNQSINLFAESSGKIESIKVNRGQNVAKGQLLAIIDSKLIDQSIKELKTALDLAVKIHEKQSKLWLNEKIGSEVQYLETKNNKETLERKLETLETQKSMTQVRAPFSGVVDEIFPKTGEMASPQMPMFRLVNLSDVYLTASVSEAYVGKVLKGTPATVEFSSLGTTLESEVVRVGNFINPDNRTFDVNVALSSNIDFKPNMMGSVNLEDYSVEEAYVVPSRLIMENTSGQSYVYLYNDADSDVSKVTRTIIVIGKSYKGYTEVLSGLKTGDMVVDKGSRSVKDDQRVRLVNLQ